MLVTLVQSKRRFAVPACALVGAALTLAACGGSSGASGASTSPAANGGVAQNGGNGFANRPGANGKIAAITGTTMQVQNPQSGQVAVKWTANTTFSHPVQVSLSAVKAGDCVVATSSSGSAKSTTPFTATDVTITAPVNGTCGGPTRAGGPGSGGAASGAPRSFPSGAPTSLPSGAAGRFPRTGSFAAGKVTSVSSDSIVIAAQQFGTNASTTSRTVKVGAQTTISAQRRTTAKSLTVGQCVNAQGATDSAGAITAKSVRISAPVNGQCTLAVFGGRNG
jgi:hypothetical protein